MAEVRGDSRICIVDTTGTIKTVILEEDFPRYKAKGWKVVTSDWTKDRQVHKPVDAALEQSVRGLASGERVSE